MTCAHEFIGLFSTPGMHTMHLLAKMDCVLAVCSKSSFLLTGIVLVY